MSMPACPYRAARRLRAGPLPIFISPLLRTQPTHDLLHERAGVAAAVREANVLARQARLAHVGGRFAREQDGRGAAHAQIGSAGGAACVVPAGLALCTRQRTQQEAE